MNKVKKSQLKNFPTSWQRVDIAILADKILRFPTYSTFEKKIRGVNLPINWITSTNKAACSFITFSDFFLSLFLCFKFDKFHHVSEQIGKIRLGTATTRRC